MVLHTSLLNTQQSKVRIKGKVEQRAFLHLGVVAIEKGAFWSLSTKGDNFTLLTFLLTSFVKFFYLSIKEETDDCDRFS